MKILINSRTTHIDSLLKFYAVFEIYGNLLQDVCIIQASVNNFEIACTKYIQFWFGVHVLHLWTLDLKLQEKGAANNNPSLGLLVQNYSTRFKKLVIHFSSFFWCVYRLMFWKKIKNGGK